MPISQPGEWKPESKNVDCSVVSHSNVLMTPTTLTLEVATDDDDTQEPICNDPNFLSKVNKALVREIPIKKTLFSAGR